MKAVCVCVCLCVCLCVCAWAQLYSNMCDPMDYTQPGSSNHGSLQASVLDWVAISFSMGSSQPNDWTCVSWASYISRWILYHCSKMKATGTRKKKNACLYTIAFSNGSRNMDIFKPQRDLNIEVFRGLCIIIPHPKSLDQGNRKCSLRMTHAAATAAKSLQSCLTLCNPIDSSSPGSPIPGILQARTLEWVAISFSNAWKWKVKVKSFSCVRLLVTPWTAAHQAPPSMGFSRQEYWSGVPLPSPEDDS